MNYCWYDGKIIDVVGLRGIQTLYLDEYDMNEEVSAALGGLQLT